MMKTACSALSPFLFAALFALSSGCGRAAEPAACPDGDEIAGQCAGTPQAPVCEDDACTAGVDCTRTVTVSDDASLGSAASAAAAGTCIVLRPGAHYGAVSLPGGVSLLGKLADSVTVGGVSIGPGKGAVVRGVSVGSGGIHVQGAQGARIESVRVSGAEAAGIDVTEGSSVTVRTSTIEGGARHGITAADGAVVTIERTIIEGNQGPGLWSACSADCGCMDQPMITVRGSILRDNHIGGVVVFASALSIEDTDILRTHPGDDWSYGMGGGGLTAATCSSVTAASVRVTDNQSYGVLIDDSAATLGGVAGAQSVEVSRNVIGFWAQNISKSGPQTVTLDHAKLEDNVGVGIGVDKDSMGLIICKSAVSGTSLSSLYVVEGGSQDVGDGLLWLGGSSMAIDGLSLSGSARASVLIDGAASGSMTSVTLGGGDENKGIVQQNYVSGSQPAVGANAPAITVNAAKVFSTPKAPASVPRNL